MTLEGPLVCCRMRGLYLITRPLAGGVETLSDAVEAALRGGARLVQYRDKGDDRDRRLAEVDVLRDICRRHGTPLIVNDDVALAAESGADGVHLGRGDTDIEVARQLLGTRALIGASCYNDLELARRAAAAGANYVAFGSFFASPTKPDAARATTDLLRRARRQLQVPVCAIGGITPENGGELVRAGADLLAVISGVFDADDREAAASRYARLFESQPERQ